MQPSNLLFRKKWYYITSVVMVVCLRYGSSQNLVIDPSLENYISCPTNFTLSSNPPEPLTQTWYIPTLGTSDYFNACAVSTPMYVPQNFFGSQEAFSGNGYAGIFVFSSNIADYREYIESQLISPMTAGQTYDIGFYVSLSDSSEIYIKELGARLSTVNLGGSFNTNITAAAQVISNNFLSDKQNWQLVKGYYTSSGGEQFITIGNFSVDAVLDLSIFTNVGPDAVSYYYIDSVFVSPCIPFNAGLNGSLTVCSSISLIDLSDYLNGGNSGGLWYDPSWNVISNTLYPSTSASGIYHYVGGYGSCADSADLQLTIQNVGSAGLDNIISICAITDLTSLLLGTPTPGGVWYGPDGSIFNQPFDPSTDLSGNYTYVVSNGNCFDSAHLFIFLNQPANASFISNINQGCSPLTVTFTMSDSGNNLKDAAWNFGDGQTGSSASVTHTYSDSGCYSVSLSISTTGGCLADTLLNDIICVSETPVADFSFSPENPSLDNPLVTFNNLCSGADNFIWQFGTLNSTAEKNPLFEFPVDEADYSICLTATSAFGCADSICKTISFKYGPSLLIAPNAFTPNGDGLNDRFIVYGKWLESIEIKIFDRWGNLVFETTDAENGWDGQKNGKKESAGVYVFLVNASFLDGQHIMKTGNLTLLR